MIKFINNFIKSEAVGGVLLVLVSLIALAIENSSWSPYYTQFLEAPISISFHQYALSKPVLMWVNDGLMAVFFLLVGLEIKREVLQGELNSLRKASLPIIAAVGGMLIPALIYAFINRGNSMALQGWAIPSATDIAFSLGVLSLLRSRVPLSLKIFLAALAIIDDLGAILIIAIYYTEQLSLVLIGVALVCVAILILLNKLGVTRFLPYALLGLVMWFAVLKSGVHATLAGVALALTYPVQSTKANHFSPAKDLEHKLLPWVSYFILPLFAFANAGVPLKNLSLETLLQPVTLGIILGLFIGKQLGIFGFSWLAIKFKLAPMPYQANWLTLYGVSVICGIGFTMSLFIGSLAFTGAGLHYAAMVRIGVLAGSLFSGLWGALVILLFSPKKSVKLA